MEDRACYIFQPDQDAEDGRSTKRRKIASKKTDSSAAVPTALFSPLLDGFERPENVALRYDTFRELWAAQEAKINGAIQDLYEGTFSEVCEFIRGVSIQGASIERLGILEEELTGSYEERIPTGVILTGPGIASHNTLFSNLRDRIHEQDIGPAVVLTSAASFNVKAILKRIIQDVTKSSDDDEEVDSKGMLNYDLQILHNYVLRNGTQKVVIAFQDSDAFDGAILTELVYLFASWLTRIPFVLLFGVATSIDLFHEKLPKSAIQRMRGRKFDVARDDELFEKVFNVSVRKDSPLLLGPALCSSMVTRQRDQVQSVLGYVNGLKYAYMAHFYANALSVLLAPGAVEQLQSEHLIAIRRLSSFKRRVERALENNDAASARALIEDDEFLRQEVATQIKDTRAAIEQVLEGVDVLDAARSATMAAVKTTKATMYIDALSEDFRDYEMVRKILLHVKTMGSQGLEQLLEGLLALPSLEKTSELHLECVTLKEELDELVRRAGSTGLELKNKNDVKLESSRTSAVSRKAEIDKHRLTLSRTDAAYAKLVSRLHKTLKTYFDASFHIVTDLFLVEVFLYDLRVLHLTTFNPKPRQAIERALARPHDYLDCDCCVSSAADGSGGTLSASQPPTAILYQLYLESGALINLQDLWAAFFAIIGGENGEDCEENVAKALFYHGLSELRMLGMIRQSKKKTDHIAKLSWKGL